MQCPMLRSSRCAARPREGEAPARPIQRHAWRRRPACVLVVAVALAGCDLPGKPNPADRPRLPSADLSFASLYAQNCAGCHGVEGQMGPAPPLNDPLFLAMTPLDELMRVIERGRRGTPMPPFAASEGGSLTAEQVRALAEGLPRTWRSKEQAPPSLPSYASRAPGDAVRGAAVYARACVDCHADDGPATLDNPAFLALISDQALRRVILTGRPDLGMPDYADGAGRPEGFTPLTPAEVDDLVALLASWRSPSTGALETMP